MGRIRTILVKRTGTLLLQDNLDKFNSDFEHNKKVVSDVAVIYSKKLRNLISGYITKLVKQKK